MTVNRQIKEGAVGARKRAATVRGRTYQYEPCNSNYGAGGVSVGTLPTGADGTFGRWFAPGGEVLYRFNGINTGFGPEIANVNGKLRVTPTLTNNIGIEYLFGRGLPTAGGIARHDHVVGGADTPAAFAKIDFEIQTVAGTDQCLFGYRKVENFQADYNNYDEMAAFNVNGGNVFVTTILNNGATSAVDSGRNWADGESHELKLIIGEPGLPVGTVRFFFDGDQIGVNPFAFDLGEKVQPFFYFLNDTAGTEVYWNWFEIGRVKDVERAI